MIVQWREDSKIIEASAENDFRFQRLLGMVCTMEWDRIHFWDASCDKIPYFLVKIA